MGTVRTLNVKAGGTNRNSRACRVTARTICTRNDNAT